VRFNVGAKVFEINLKAIEASDLTEDIQNLMQLRLKDLTASELELLQIAACIGSRVTK
jgi:predicted ATPase